MVHRDPCTVNLCAWADFMRLEARSYASSSNRIHGYTPDVQERDIFAYSMIALSWSISLIFLNVNFDVV